MEPVKGGSLVNLPASAQKILDQLEGGSNASYAIRFAAGFEGVIMVLSGMSTQEQMQDNLSYMTDFQPLNEQEHSALKKVCAILRNQDLIPCTACRYCTDGCPAGIDIPALFACLNDKREGKEANYDAFEVKADACVECGQCEGECPQHLQIRDLLKEVAAAF